VGEIAEIVEAEAVHSIVIIQIIRIMVETIATMVDITTTIIKPKHQGLNALWSCAPRPKETSEISLHTVPG
jgi:hypothetical protein